MEYIHGGDWAGYKMEYGEEPLDFSANVSPLGLPNGVRKAMEKSLDHGERYPDPKCRALRSSLAAFHGVSEEDILCGNGAADLIYRLALALKPKSAFLTAPCFAEYGLALQTVGCRLRQYVLLPEDDFHIREDILKEITPDLDLVILCEPNNPTGVTTDRDLLLKILQRCRETGCLLVVDECFNSFLDEPEKHTLLPCLPGGNLFVLRAFTKFYGMAGIRLGYGLCADHSLLEKMERAAQPWAVSTPAQAGGIAALKEEKYGKKLRNLIKKERPRMEEALRSLGCRVIAGEANYLLFFCGEVHLEELLRSRGILVRPCRNYPGLTEGWYRVAVRKEEENRLLISALREVL